MRVFYGSQLSEHRTRTPEGFLICHAVPLARTGDQGYYGREIGMPDRERDLITVHRTEDEVFSVPAMASFEGKPVTNDHPPEGVRPDNASAYVKGHVQNVRRGMGEDGDKMVGDLVIVDAQLIAEIEAGKREVSCGYQCEYAQDETGEIYQIGIRGNHVAVVSQGRAGDTVAIRDASPIERERSTEQMPKTRKNILARMFGAYAKDATPEEIADAMEAVGGCDGGDAAPAEREASDTDPVLSALTEILALLKKGNEKPVQEADPLDALEAEITPESENENTLPAGQMDEDPESTSAISDEEPQEEARETGDRAAMLRMIRAIKPTLAQLPSDQRKSVSDALAKDLRLAIGKPPVPKTNGYAAVAKATQDAARKKAGQTSVIDFKAVDAAYAARNPHSKKN